MSRAKAKFTELDVKRVLSAAKKAGVPVRVSISAVGVMFRWARREGRIPLDSTAGVIREKVKTTGYPTWSEAEIARFEAKHPIGSKARLAFALLLYTGQRRGDIVRLGRQHMHPDPHWE